MLSNRTIGEKPSRNIERNMSMICICTGRTPPYLPPSLGLVGPVKLLFDNYYKYLLYVPLLPAQTMDCV